MSNSKKTDAHIMWVYRPVKDGYICFDGGFLVTGPFPMCFSRLFGEQLRVELEDAFSVMLKKYLPDCNFEVIGHLCEEV